MALRDVPVFRTIGCDITNGVMNAFVRDTSRGVLLLPPFPRAVSVSTGGTQATRHTSATLTRTGPLHPLSSLSVHSVLPLTPAGEFSSGNLRGRPPGCTPSTSRWISSRRTGQAVCAFSINGNQNQKPNGGGPPPAEKRKHFVIPRHAVRRGSLCLGFKLRENPRLRSDEK